MHKIAKKVLKGLSVSSKPSHSIETKLRKSAVGVEEKLEGGVGKLLCGDWAGFI